MPIKPSVTPPIATETLRRSWQWLSWRVALFVIVFALALLPFFSGVATTDRPYIPDSNITTRVYYALGLFVFGGLDIGVPEGGPHWAFVMAWFAYFLAPLITTSAVIEGVLHAIRPRDWRLRRLRGHIVVVGCGRLTLLYLQRLREHNPRQPVLVVEKQHEHPSAEAAALRYRVEVLYGDITSEAVLDSLRLPYADRVVLLTGDDFVNLNTASRMRNKAEHLAPRILLHLRDTQLKHQIADHDILPECAKFNSHETAAQHLVGVKLLPHFQQTHALDIVVIAGFGRFGQTVLDELQRRAQGSFSTVVLLDIDATDRALEFEERVGFVGGYHCVKVDGDLRSPRTWQRVQPYFEEAGDELALILGSNDAGSNILTALRLSSKFPDAYIVARCFYHTNLTEQLAEQCHFDIESFADLLLESMDAEWFEPPPRWRRRRWMSS